MTSRGRLLVLEGPDGVGKTTLARSLAERLRSEEVGRVRELSFPRGAEHSLGRLVYDVHHEPERFGIRTMDRTSLQLLHIAAHIDTIETTIRPHVLSGGWVVLDRFWWSTWVYARASGVPEASLEAMIGIELLHWADILPDLVLLIDREAPLRPGSDMEEFRNLRRLYADLARDEEPDVPVRTVHNQGSVYEATDECLRIIRELEPHSAGSRR